MKKLNVLDLYTFEGFDKGNTTVITEQVSQLPAKQSEVIQEVFDVKEVRSSINTLLED